MRLPRLVLVVTALLAMCSPAFADATVFLGNTSTPTGRQARGVAVGGGVLAIGFEFEYSNTKEKVEDAAPSLNTGTGNLLLQTPFAIFGLQPYFETGAGFYHETLGSQSETNVTIGTGGGVKISLLGPVRARIDYRAFKLRGTPLGDDVVHRTYIGLNLKF
jgi:hypothetical protein